jgi:ABC-2 type transport system ATP-binding protein
MILKVKNLSKSYGRKKAVDQLSFEVEKGTVFGLLGPNGAGKSTTIDCLLGIKKRDGGQVLFFERESELNNKLFKRISVQFQQDFFPERIKVYEMCQMIDCLYDDTEDYMDLIKKFGLYEYLKQDVNKLSGGERQKLSVLLSLISKPELVFLDELTTGLDPIARREVWGILSELKDQGLTIVLTSHYMDEVTVLCDRIAIIDKGVKRIEGRVDEVVKACDVQSLEEAYLKIIGQEVPNEKILTAL